MVTHVHDRLSAGVVAQWPCLATLGCRGTLDGDCNFLADSAILPSARAATQKFMF